MSERDLRAFFGKTLDYPGVPSKAHPEGSTYKVPSPDATTGLWLTALAELSIKQATGVELSPKDAESLVLDDEQELTFMQRVLGSAYGQMIEDGVAWSDLQLITGDAMKAFAVSEQFADAVLAVEVGNRKARRTRAPKASTRRQTAGSKSNRVSSGTPARTRNRASTSSSAKHDQTAVA